MKKKIVVSVIILFFAVAIWGVWGQGKRSSKVAKEQQASQGSQEAMQHQVTSFNLEGLTEKGEKKWEVTGQSAQSISENELRLDNIVAKAYGEEAEATITASSGIYDKAKNNVRLDKDVNATIEMVEGSQGELFDFSSSSAKKEHKQGDKKEKTKTLITCDGEVVFDYERNVAYFNKNVKVVSDQVKIEADKISVNLDAESKKIKEIVGEGNVKISRGDNITYSDKATYVEADKKIILTGKPRLIIYQEGGVEGNFMGELNNVQEARGK